MVIGTVTAGPAAGPIAGIVPELETDTFPVLGVVSGRAQFGGVVNLMLPPFIVPTAV